MSPPSGTSLPSAIPSHPLGCHTALGGAPCVTQQILTGSLFYIYGNIYVPMLTIFVF